MQVRAPDPKAKKKRSARVSKNYPCKKGELTKVALVFYHPAFRSKQLNIISIYLLVPVDDPWVGADDSLGRKIYAIDSGTFGRYDTWKAHSDSRMKAKCFIHDSLQIRHRICFFQFDRITQLAVTPKVIDLLH